MGEVPRRAPPGEAVYGDAEIVKGLNSQTAEAGVAE